MRISVKGRNLPVSDELREHVAKRFNKVARQVSELAELEVEVFEERNPAIADSQVAEATLHLKRVTLRARDASPDIVHSINLVSDELAKQVKRHREKRRKRREARAAGAHVPAEPEIPLTDDPSDLGEPVVEGVLLEPAPERAVQPAEHRPADAA
jgi:putative sigma-54 modulation protein